MGSTRYEFSKNGQGLRCLRLLKSIKTGNHKELFPEYPRFVSIRVKNANNNDRRLKWLANLRLPSGGAEPLWSGYVDVVDCFLRL